MIGIGPFVVTVDEYAAIVTPGFEIVLTQGRGLGIAAIIASQDYPGMLEADRKGTQQMVANTALKIFMKIDDKSTKELAHSLTGQAQVSRTSGYQATKGETAYYDNMGTAVENLDRVHLRDLQTQIEGEAHYIFRGQLVRGDMFYANPSLKNVQLRVPQLLGIRK
jgi:intracellular multiplication protein IcmO